MNKIAQEIVAIAQEILADESTALFDAGNVADVITQFKNHIKAPFINISSSSLGGDDRMSILMTISLDKKETWSNNILHNSRYFQMSFRKDGTIELFSGGTRKAKFRKTKAKSIDDAIAKINKYIGEAEKITDWYAS